MEGITGKRPPSRRIAVRARRAWIPVAVLAAGLLVAAALGSLVERPARVVSDGGRAEQPARTVAPASGDGIRVAEAPAVDRVAERAEVAAAEVAEESAADERVERVLAELARLLEDPRADRAHWESAVRALAGSLAAEEDGALLAATADPARSASARVAAAELLRVRGAPGTPALGPAALLALRGAAAAVEPHALCCAAACRALAWFGDGGDRRALVAALADPADPLRAELAAHGLQGAHATDVVPELLALALATPDEDVARRALVTLERMARGAPLGWPEPLCAQVAHAVHTAGLAPGSARARRALALLGALGGPEAEAGLVAALAGSPLAARVAAGALDARDPAVRAELDAVLAREDLAVETRLAAAEALVRPTGDGRDGATGTAREWLRAAVAGEASAAVRRRAVAALAGLDDPADREWLAELARSEAGLGLHTLLPGASASTRTAD